MGIALYENAMQVVPLMLVALFLDNRNSGDRSSTPRSQRWERLQDRGFTVLGVAAFMLSMFVVAGVLAHSRITDAIVIAALSGCISLLFAQIWRRFGRRQPRSGRPGAERR